MEFKDLQLITPILKALKDKNYTTPTAIQAKSIPVILKGNDVLGSAQTGTGKTAAFAIPIIQRLIEDNAPNLGRRKIRTLVITPTRELAIQIAENFTDYSKYTDLKNTVIFGGVGQTKQVTALKKGVDIVIATPGRLLDLISQGYISLKDIKYFILDEADRMLNMGFVHEIKKLIALLPKQRQSLFFSATMPQNILKLSNEILVNPKKITVNPVSSTAQTIQQYLYTTNKSNKNELLLHILNRPEIEQALVFARTKHGADRIVKKLKKSNVESAAIHGDKSQNQRQRALAQFKEHKITVLIATDIAARGIDIDKLKFVINFDIPNEPETYVHRIGRCGRAGENGVAISICEPEENEFVRDIEKTTKKKIEIITDNPFPQTDKAMSPSEKKTFEKEKQKRKQEFFTNRKKNQNKSSKGNSRSRNRRK